MIRQRLRRGLAVSDVRVVEPDDPGAVKVVATVALWAPQPSDVSVTWFTKAFPSGPPGAAQEGADFLVRSGTAVIPAGHLDTRVQLWVPGDTAVEGPEQFQLVLNSNSTNLVISDGTGTVTIVDDEGQLPVQYEMASVTTDSAPAGAQDGGDLSADGRYIAFFSSADNVVEDADFTRQDVFVRDRMTGITRRASTAPDGKAAIVGGARARSAGASLSADGRFVAFSSDATNLVPGDTNGQPDIFVKDMLTGGVTRASVAWDGSQGSGRPDQFAISSQRTAPGSASSRPTAWYRTTPTACPTPTCTT